ncbi:FeoA domain-containing protein [Desulfospira joergensenii]|uniref:FeoA domain-containing protein n=1 Tax=Desulfospira joergensenii TaxID=53329 RepID=UPI0003B37BED|nr:FeoA domain-containing protein [Desulfospira joergensenii]
MHTRHEQEKRQFVRLFKEQGLDRFDQRFQVLEAFLKLEDHVTLQEISRQLKADGIKLDDEFIFSSMEHLCRFGFALKAEFDQDRDTLYEHRHLGVHHDHMICTKCGSILEFKDEALEKQQKKVTAAYGFYMLQHKMEIYGLCSGCMASRKELVPLNRARQGEKMIIKEVDAGTKMQLRISSMGLRIGDPVEILSSGFGGQIVVASGQNRLVIGTGMAQKIWVRHFGKDDLPEPDKIRDREGKGKTMPLSRMKSGQEAVIVRVSGERLLRRRLLEMGINRGTKIYVEKYAPLKDPLELVVKGYHVSLRVEEAANILVEQVHDRQI